MEKIQMIINEIIKHRSKGNRAIATSIKTRLILKGIPILQYDKSDPSYNPYLPDDPIIISKLMDIANEFGIKIDFIE